MSRTQRVATAVVKGRVIAKAFRSGKIKFFAEFQEKLAEVTKDLQDETERRMFSNAMYDALWN